MRIVQIFMQLQEFLWVDFIFRYINSRKTYSGGFLSTWRPNRKSFENQAHFVSLSEMRPLFINSSVVCINIMHIMTPFDHSIRAVRMKENGVHLINLINVIHSTDSCTPDKCVSNGRKWCLFDRFE